MAYPTKVFDVATPDYEEVAHVVPSAKVAGDFETLNSLNGFYFADVAINATGSIVTKAKKVKVQKTTGETWTVGEPVYYVAGTSKVSNVAGANTLIGYVAEAGASADTEGLINFDGFLAFAKA